jgi:iduronate 2-sulfatase
MSSSSVVVSVVWRFLCAMLVLSACCILGDGPRAGSLHGGEPIAARNVLLICVDDLKPLLGCYGDALAKTPNIDRLASSGILFRNAYCNQAVCAPSRNALLTGFRPQTLGIYDLGTHFRKSSPDCVTLPQYFKNVGYRAEGMGKIFHVGHGNVNDKLSWSLPHWNAKVVGYALSENRAPQGLTREEALFENDKTKPIRSLPKGAVIERAEVEDQAYADGVLAERVVERLAYASAHPDEQFFMAVGFVKPHLPFCAPARYWDMHDPAKFELAKLQSPPEGAPEYAPTKWGELRQYRGVPESGALDEDLQRKLIHGYYAAASYMDAQVGKALEALESSGLSENTIVVLWGDHGWHLGDHGMWCKHSNYEQAARIPLIVRVPGKPPAEVRGMVETVDIYPTLVELAGLGRVAGLDGDSFARAIDNPEAELRDHVIHVFPRGQTLGRAIRTDRYRLVQWKRFDAGASEAEWELYDYQVDPLERKNLIDDVDVGVVEQLKKKLESHPVPRPQVK